MLPIHCQDNIDVDKTMGSIKSLEFNGQHWQGLVLHRPQGLSLPNHQDVVSALKSLDGRLNDAWLITTVVQCSNCHSSNAKVNTMRKKWPKYNNKGSRLVVSSILIPLGLTSTIRQLLEKATGDGSLVYPNETLGLEK